ncbi:MAG: hypothetical protein HY319_13265 [Armatimonadetes bacterium]|nr:hypothetical protein [Armatimonadota bacterium]
MLKKLQPYADAIGSLPGVSGLSASRGKNKTLKIYTESERDSQFLDRLLEDTIESHRVEFEAIGKIRAQALANRTPQPAGARGLVARYGAAIEGLPGVLWVGVGLSSSAPGEKALRIDVPSADEARFLDRLLEDEIEGTEVLIQQRHPIYAR